MFVEAFQERAMGHFREQAATQFGHRRLQIDRDAVPVHPFHIIEKTGCAAAAGNDGLFVSNHLMQRFPFDLPKGSFSGFFENCLNGLAFLVFNPVV